MGTLMTIDPVTVVQTAAATWAGLRLCHSVADWLVLCGRTQLARAAAALPPGSQITGRGWEIRVPAGQRQR
jgi:hypothetical protein